MDEQRAAEAILAICDEDTDRACAALQVLSLTDDTRDWYGALAEAAMTWPPFVERGLSIDWWLEQVARAL